MSLDQSVLEAQIVTPHAVHNHRYGDRSEAQEKSL